MRLTHALNSLRTLDLGPLVFCDERQPVCTRCESFGFTHCVHQPVAGGDSTRERDLQLQLDCKSRDLQVAILLLRVLRHSADNEASMALARLRLMEETGRLIASLRVGDTSGLG